MSTTGDKIVYHSGGHLKRADASSLSNGSYAFKVTNGSISVAPVQASTSVTTSSFKKPSGDFIFPDPPFIPVAQNTSGFLPFYVPTVASNVCAIVNNGAGEYQSVDIQGGNVIKKLFQIYPSSTGSQMYYYNTSLDVWKEMSVSEGYTFLKNNSGTISTVTMNGVNLFEYGFGYTKSDNLLIQYNKGEVHNIAVPTTAGNYNLNVDTDGNVSFSQGEITQRQAVTYKLYAKTNAPTLNGSDIVIHGSGTDGLAYTPSLNLKSNSKYYVDARFWFKITDTSVFDDMSDAVAVTFKIGSGSDNVIGKHFIFHPESGVLELHFTGISGLLTSATPDMYLVCDSSFTTLKVGLPFVDSTNAAQITFVEV